MNDELKKQLEKILQDVDTDTTLKQSDWNSLLREIGHIPHSEFVKLHTNHFPPSTPEEMFDTLELCDDLILKVSIEPLEEQLKSNE